MARLPTPGGDNGNWGTILNDFLTQTHNTDGTLKDDSVGVGQLRDNSVTAAALATGAVTKADVDLANVDNTSDATKPVSTATQTALDAKAPLSSPSLTGTPTAPTPAAGDNSTKVATTAYTQTELGLLVPKSILTTDGDLFTRTGGAVTRISRADLAADPAFTGAFAPIDAVSDHVAATDPHGDRVYADSLGVAGPAVGGWTTPVPRTLASTGLPVEARYVPLWVPFAATFDTLRVNVTAAGDAGSLVRLGVFAADGLNRWPGTLLQEGTVSGAAIAQVNLALTSVAVSRPSLLWVAFRRHPATVAQPALSWMQERTDGGLATTHPSYLFNGGAEQSSHLHDGASGGSNTFAASPIGTGLFVSPQGSFMFALKRSA